MPVRETEAMVIRSHPLGESDRIVTFLTRAAGKVRAVAKGALSVPAAESEPPGAATCVQDGSEADAVPAPAPASQA